MKDGRVSPSPSVPPLLHSPFDRNIRTHAIRGRTDPSSNRRNALPCPTGVLRTSRHARTTVFIYFIFEKIKIPNTTRSRSNRVCT